jgi:hypothetical protein
MCCESDHRVFTSSDFTTIIFYRARSSVLHATPNLEDQDPVFMSPSDMVVQLYTQAPGYLLLTFINSQGYDGGILTHLHMGS